MERSSRTRQQVTARKRHPGRKLRRLPVAFISQHGQAKKRDARNQEYLVVKFRHWCYKEHRDKIQTEDQHV